MSKENRRKMYEQIKDNPVKLKASGLAEEFGAPKPKVLDQPKKADAPKKVK